MLLRCARFLRDASPTHEPPLDLSLVPLKMKHCGQKVLVDIHPKVRGNGDGDGDDSNQQKMLRYATALDRLTMAVATVAAAVAGAALSTVPVSLAPHTSTGGC